MSAACRATQKELDEALQRRFVIGIKVAQFLRTESLEDFRVILN
jgi:hypothetical protein